MRRKYSYILIWVVLISCKGMKISDDESKIFIPISGLGKFQLSDSIGFIGSDTLLKSYYPDSTLKAIGRYAITRDSLISNFKIGEHQEFYPNGILKSMGAYQISWYRQCCYKGPCAIYYNYKVGLWTTYYENGQTKMKGSFIAKDKFINTSCKGGATLKYSETDLKSLTAFDTSGLPIKPNELMQLEFEKIYTEIAKDYKIAWHLDPKNRKVVVNSVEK